MTAPGRHALWFGDSSVLGDFPAPVVVARHRAPGSRKRVIVPANARRDLPSEARCTHVWSGPGCTSMRHTCPKHTPARYAAFESAHYGIPREA